MSVHGVGRGRRQVQLTHLLAHIPRDELDGRRHFRDNPFSFCNPRQTGLTETFLLGDRPDRVDLTLDIICHELAVTTYAALQVDKVVGVAHGAEALADPLALLSEALVLLTSGFHVLRTLLQTHDRLWGTTGPTLCRLAVGGVEALLHPVESLFCLRHGLVSSLLFGGHGCRDGLVQFL